MPYGEQTSAGARCTVRTIVEVGMRVLLVEDDESLADVLKQGPFRADDVVWE